MAYEMVMPYHLHMPSYFLETFTEYPCSKNPRIMQQDFRNHVARFADFRWSFPVLFAILLYQSVYHFIAQFFCFGKICTGFFVFL